MHYFVTSEIIRRRVVTNIDHQWRITSYGENNLYPQIMAELYKKSPLTKSAIQVHAEFYTGEGWTQNKDVQVNRFGQSWDEILRLVAHDLATFTGFALHLNYNGSGQIVEVQHMPFEFPRLGIKNINGVTTYCMISSNWEDDAEKHTNFKGIDPIRFSLFNPRTAAKETINRGRGQILYWTPSMFNYPLATFDAVRDSVQTDAEIQTFMLKNIQNGFLGTTIFKIPGGLDSQGDRDNVEAKVRSLQGSFNANSIVIAETPEDFTGSLIEPIPAPNNDKLFDATEVVVRNKILQNFSIPGALMGVAPEGSVFTNQQIKESYDYVNARTKNKRLLLERVFAPIATLFGTPLGSIKKQEFEITGLNEGRVNQVPEKEEPEEEEEQVKPQAKMKQIYG